MQPWDVSLFLKSSSFTGHLGDCAVFGAKLDFFSNHDIQIALFHTRFGFEDMVVHAKGYLLTLFVQCEGLCHDKKHPIIW